MKAACSSCGTPYSAPSVDSSASDVRVRCQNCGEVFDIQGPARDNKPRTPRGQWYYAAEGDSFGPYTEGELREKYQTGELEEDTYVWTKGFDEWIPASAHSAFATAMSLAIQPKHSTDSPTGADAPRGTYVTPVEALDALPEDPLYYPDDTIEYTPDDDPHDRTSQAFVEEMFDDVDDLTEEYDPTLHDMRASDPSSTAAAQSPSTDKADTLDTAAAANKPERAGAPKKNKKQAAAKPRPLPPPLTPDRAIAFKTGAKPRRKTAVMAALSAAKRRPAAPPKPTTPPKVEKATDSASPPLSLAERLRQMRDKPTEPPTSDSTSTAPSLPPRDSAPETTQRDDVRSELPPKTKPKKSGTIRMVALNAPPTDTSKPSDEAQASKRPKKSRTVRMVALNEPVTDTATPDPTDASATEPTDTASDPPPTATAPAEKPAAKSKKGKTIILGSLPLTSAKPEKIDEIAAGEKTPAEESKTIDEEAVGEKTPAKGRKGRTVMLGGLPSTADKPEKTDEKVSAPDKPSAETSPATHKEPTPDTTPAAGKSSALRAAKTSTEPKPTTRSDVSPKKTAATPTTSAQPTPKEDEPSRRGFGLLLVGLILLGVATIFGWKFLFGGDPLPAPAPTASVNGVVEEPQDTARWDEAHTQAQSMVLDAEDAAAAAALEAGVLIQNQRIEARGHASETISTSLDDAQTAAQRAEEKAAAEREAAARRRREAAARRQRTPTPRAVSPLDNTAVKPNRAGVPSTAPKPRRQNQNAPSRRRTN